MTYSLRPSIGPINRPPPWRRGGFHSFQGVGSYVESPGFHYEYATAGLGNVGPPVQYPAATLQQALIQRGFNVGSSGADGIWGNNSQTALNRASGSTVPVTVTGARGSQVVSLPPEILSKVLAMPLRSGGTSTSSGSSSSSSGSSSSSTSTPTPIGPDLDPPADTGAQDGGLDWGQIWPWAIGAGAFVTLGGYFLWKGSKRRPAASPAPVTANRRRSRRRVSKNLSNKRIFWGRVPGGADVDQNSPWYAASPQGAIRQFRKKATAQKAARALAKKHNVQLSRDDRMNWLR